MAASRQDFEWPFPPHGGSRNVLLRDGQRDSLDALADEGGVSFWLPGTYGSLASVPAVPGWSFSIFN